ncbi:fasciclin domain-containing protein [Deinococcus sp. YIM 134068]|uniref:fasciclin domain-containing protein n=1 Tax=Deinococcus lichenicola TaxID=3118910 RepID=UPI002F93F9F9
MRKQIMAVSAALLLTSPAVAGGGAGVPTGNTIAAAVANNPDFSTLLSAVQAAGLTQTLSGPGPFTVFAPTNAAFAKVPADQLQALLNNPAQLRAVLLYHVVPGRVTSTQVAGLTSATTAQGGSLTVSASGGTVQINDATVTQADLAASNGIIHVIDTVLLPPS